MTKRLAALFFLLSLSSAQAGPPAHQVLLTWNASLDSIVLGSITPVGVYRIWRIPAQKGSCTPVPAPASWVLISSIAAALQPTFTDSTVPSSGAFCYTVSFVDTTGAESDQATPALATIRPSAPTGLVAK